MKILLVGSGGREHALLWKIAQSSLVDKIFCAPGSHAMEDLAQRVDIGADNLMGLADFAQKENIQLTVVGPEQPLVNGIVDIFQQRDLPIFGPQSKAAALEGSKIFAKNLMNKYHIPTAAFFCTDDLAQAKKKVANFSMPIVIKADGLAAGKGVVICHHLDSAFKTLETMMSGDMVGEAGKKVVIEEFLQGIEASYMVLSDGRNVLPLASSQDHKRVFEGDEGPNTGGMGAYSPVPFISPETEKNILNKIVFPLSLAMSKEDCPYSGILYFGLMLTSDGPKVLEINCRFGDPETQPLMMRLKTDLVKLFLACSHGRLSMSAIEWDPRTAACVVMAAGGYPGKYSCGEKIEGLKTIDGQQNTQVFHASTRKEGDQWFTNGGRVLSITSLGNDLKDAIHNAYKSGAHIRWKDCHFRKDIGYKGLDFLTKG